MTAPRRSKTAALRAKSPRIARPPALHWAVPSLSQPEVPGRRVRLGALTIGGLAILTACSAVGIEENTFESGPLPAIADADVARVLAGLDDALNEANAARDPELLATVVADPLLAVEAARYALDATADPEDADSAPRVEHEDTTAFLPQFTGYPQWFVTVSAVVPDTPQRIEVLTRDGSAEPWTLSMSTDLLPGVEFPTLALDEDGYVVPVDAEEADLPVAPADVVTEHVAALGGMAESAIAEGLAEDTWTVQRVESDAGRPAAVGDAATVSATYEAGETLPQMLRTEDGGALVFYALTERVGYSVAANYFLQLDAATAALVGTDRITTSLTEDWTALVATYVPPDEDGTPRVIAARFDRTGLTGS